MGKNSNAKKLKSRLISSDPGAANRLNNIRLNNPRIREMVATEVTGHYDLSHDLDAFDAAMQIGMDKSPADYFDDLDSIQIGDLKVEGDEVMFLEDEEDGAYESLLGCMLEDDELSEDDFGFAEDMSSAVESSLDIPVFEIDEDDEAMEAASKKEAEDEVYEMLLEEDELDDDIDLDDDLDGDLDDDDEDLDDPSEEEIIDMEDDDLLDPSLDDEF